MQIYELEQLVKLIVSKANELKNQHTEYGNIPVNYACIFAHDNNEYDELLKVTKTTGKVVLDTPTGFVFEITPIKTIAGDLYLLKIRKPDSDHRELGDADFTVPDFEEFKSKYIKQAGFKLIDRDKYVMIELMNSLYDVRVYFSNPTLSEQLGFN